MTATGTWSQGTQSGSWTKNHPAYSAGPGSASTQGTITITRTWVGPGTCPSKCYIKETCDAGAAAVGAATPVGDPGGSGGTASASDGLGDDPTGPAGSADSHGSHLFQVDSSSGVISRSVSVSASASDNGLGLTCSAGASFSWEFDNRSVAIHSDLEQTYHKNQATGLPEQNQRAASGFMVADTVAPLSGVTLTVNYSPIYDRTDWGGGSQYHWQSASGLDLSGSFNTFFLPNVPSPNIDYTNPPTVPGSNDYVILTLTDSDDGAIASNSYSVLFHDYYEQWKRTATEDHPGPFLEEDGSINPEWTYIVTNDNNSPASPSISLSQAYTASVTETGSISGQAQLTAPGIAALQRNESITVGETCTGTITTSYQFAGAPWTSIKYYVAKTYQERWGTCDVYASNGFQGTANWYGISATNPMALSIHAEAITQYPH